MLGSQSCLLNERWYAAEVDYFYRTDAIANEVLYVFRDDNDIGFALHHWRRRRVEISRNNGDLNGLCLTFPGEADQ